MDADQEAIATTPALTDLIAEIVGAIGSYQFTTRAVAQESVFQEQVKFVLDAKGIACEREVRIEGGRYDISVRRGDLHVVLELKVKGSAPLAERQAQRYIVDPDVEAVIVVTTSNKLAAQIKRGTLPGIARDAKPGDGMVRKPFLVAWARTTL